MLDGAGSASAVTAPSSRRSGGADAGSTPPQRDTSPVIGAEGAANKRQTRSRTRAFRINAPARPSGARRSTSCL
jgi:hypothetical protein